MLTVVAYLPDMRGEFIWDDSQLFIVNNTMLDDASGLVDIWFSKKPADYYPLTYTSFWIEKRLWGDSPVGYHVVNLVLHVASALLLWRLLTVLRIPGAWLVALLFGLHPVNVESVAWISERKNTLSFLFYLASAHTFLSGPAPGVDRRLRWRWDLAALAFFVCALLAKAAGVMLPVVLIGALWWMRRKFSRQTVIRLAPFFGLSLLSGLFTLWYHCYRRAFVPARTDGFFSRLVEAGWNTWFYFYKAVFPVRLSFVYPRWQADASSVLAWFPLFLLVAVLVAAWIFRGTRTGRGVLAGMGYYVVSLLPILGFVGFAFMRFSSTADHLQYFALAGVLSLVVVGGRRTLNAFDIPPVAVRACKFVLITAFFILCWERASVYRTEAALYEDALQKNPRAWLAHMGLGNIRSGEGDLRGAIDCYSAAARVNPDLAEAHFNLGLSRLALGENLDQAAHDLSEAIRLRPTDARAYFHRGLVHFRRGKNLFAALTDLNTSLRIRPSNRDALYYRGRLYAKLNDWPSAIRDLRAAAIDATPEWSYYTDALQSLAASLAAQRTAGLPIEKEEPQGDEETEATRKAATTLLLARGTQRFRTGGDLNQAEKEFSAVLELDSDNEPARLLRGLTRLRLGSDADGAFSDLNLALHRDPNNADALFFRAQLRMSVRDFKGVAADLRRAVACAPDNWAFRERAVSILQSAAQLQTGAAQ